MTLPVELNRESRGGAQSSLHMLTLKPKPFHKGFVRALQRMSKYNILVSWDRFLCSCRGLNN